MTRCSDQYNYFKSRYKEVHDTSLHWCSNCQKLNTSCFSKDVPGEIYFSHHFQVKNLLAVDVNLLLLFWCSLGDLEIWMCTLVKGG